MKTATGTMVMVHRLLLGEVFLEPGVVAWDNIDGDITAKVEAWGMGAVTTSALTSEERPFIVTYDVEDTAGNAAKQVRRRVYVSSPCGGTIMPCADGACPDGQGRCAGDGEEELAFKGMTLQVEEEAEEVLVSERLSPVMSFLHPTLSSLVFDTVATPLHPLG